MKGHAWIVRLLQSTDIVTCKVIAGGVRCNWVGDGVLKDLRGKSEVS